METGISPAAGKEFANLFLIHPQQTVKGYRRAVIEVTLQLTGRLTIIYLCSYRSEKPKNSKWLANQSSCKSKIADIVSGVGPESRVKVCSEEVIKVAHVGLFLSFHAVSDVLHYLADKCEAPLHGG